MRFPVDPKRFDLARRSSGAAQLPESVGALALSGVFPGAAEVAANHPLMAFLLAIALFLIAALWLCCWLDEHDRNKPLSTADRARLQRESEHLSSREWL